MELLEQVQRRATKNIRGKEHLPLRGRTEGFRFVQLGEEKAVGRP